MARSTMCGCCGPSTSGLQPGSRTAWCERCGAFLSVPPGARSVRCAQCLGVTRVQPRPSRLPRDSPDFLEYAVEPPPSLLLQPLTIMCGRCGTYLSVPRGARSVCCALCHAVTRVQRRPSGLQGFLKGLIYSLMYPPEPPPSSEEDWLPASYPRVPGSRKRALLVGICYTGTEYELEGSVNDVNWMSYLLSKRLGFPSDSILVLTEEERDPNRVPTMTNILLAMRWLVQGCDTGDALSLVFYFSGHGFKEGLCAVDFEGDGVIPDYKINQAIVRPLGPGVKLHAVVDTDHSGAIVLDLPYLCRMSRTRQWQWENQNHQPPKGGTNGGLAISISGCSRQNPLTPRVTPSNNLRFHKTTLVSNQGKQLPPRTESQNPAMEYDGSVPTDNFIKAVEHQPGIGRAIRRMHIETRQVPASIGSSLIAAVEHEPSTTYGRLLHVILAVTRREPQLHASETFDIYRKPFLL